MLRLEREQHNHTLELKDEQICLLERFSPEFRERQIEVHHTGELVAIDTFFVGPLKGVGKVYLQTVLDCYSRFAFGRLYNSKPPLTAVHVLNNDVLPHFEQQGLRVETVLSDNGREFYRMKKSRFTNSQIIEVSSAWRLILPFLSYVGT